MIICTVTTASHLYRAKALALSVRKHHPEASIAVLLIEKRMHPGAGKFQDFDYVALPSQIGVPNVDGYMLQRSKHEAAYSLKVHFLRHLFDSFPWERDIVMLDSDTKLYSPMVEAMEALDGHPIVLTPHELYDAKESFLFHGVYNIGFIALRRSEETYSFLDWWMGRVDRFGFDAFRSRGLFYEQNWLNLAPALFPVHTLKHPGYNVAFWNLAERGRSIKASGKGKYLVQGVPLRFFHFSHASDLLPAVMRRFVPNRRNAVYRLHAEYMREIRKLGYRKLHSAPWSYDFDEKGTPIRKEDRERYRMEAGGGLVPGGAAARSDGQKLHVVQVVSNSPNAYPLPPVNQGGTEKIVYELTQELVKLGHRVTLYAAQGSRSSAEVIPFPAGLPEHSIGDYVARTLPPGVHIVHDHTFSSSVSDAGLTVPVVSTHHIPVRHQGANPVYVSGNALRVNGGGRGRYIYNGINMDEYEYSEEKRDYLLFMGRIMKEKGVLHAIKVAERTKLPLKIAGPVKDRTLFEKEIKPRIRELPNVEYVGAVGGAKKQQLLKHAKWLLFPSVWEEPFGLTMIEAMACGTPVLALDHGAAREVLSGFPQLVCRSAEEMAAKAMKETPPPPSELRSYVAARFSGRRMAQEYVQLYNEIISSFAAVFDRRVSRKRKPASGKLRSGKGVRRAGGRTAASRGKSGAAARKPDGRRAGKPALPRKSKPIGRRAGQIAGRAAR